MLTSNDKHNHIVAKFYLNFWSENILSMVQHTHAWCTCFYILEMLLYIHLVIFALIEGHVRHNLWFSRGGAYRSEIITPTYVMTCATPRKAYILNSL